MIDFTSDVGKRAKERIASEQIVWLTTVSTGNIPQPRPVWFIWDNETFLIYTSSQAMKVRQIERNPHVALHFNGTADGDDIQVFIGEAIIDAQTPPPAQMPAYIEKYRAGIGSINMTVESFSAAFTTAIRVKPTKLRSTMG